MREHSKSVEGSIASTAHSSVVRESSSTAPRKSLRRLFHRLSSLSGATVTRADRGGATLAAAHGATADPGESSGPVAASPVTPQVVNPNPPKAGHLTDEMIRLNCEAAAATGVVASVHPQDFIYWFCCRHPHLTLEAAISYYFSDGAHSAEKLDGIVTELGFERGQPIKLLEFASGYGCVTRHLKKHARWDLTSCDIHSEAIDFLDRQIGVKTLQSVQLPEQFATIEKYDVVFALSFFSHMPKSSFGRWLRALYGSLRAPGYLIFTTHGVKSCGALASRPTRFPRTASSSGRTASRMIWTPSSTGRPSPRRTSSSTRSTTSRAHRSPGTSKGVGGESRISGWSRKTNDRKAGAQIQRLIGSSKRLGPPHP